MKPTVTAWVAEFDARALPIDGEALAASVAALAWDRTVRCVLLLVDGSTQAPRPSHETLLSLERARLPIVCGCGGALGESLTAIVAACDVRIAGASVSFRAPGDQEFSAADALARGFVSRIAPSDDPAPAARTVAETIAARAPYATQLAKESIRRGTQLPLEQALRFETDLTLLLQTTKDRAEGVRAFIEKRSPVFLGE